LKWDEEDHLRKDAFILGTSWKTFSNVFFKDVSSD
jgi:hypothetical protein